jgi:hypothetical protein
MFWSAKFEAVVPPYILNFGSKPIVDSTHESSQFCDVKKEVGIAESDQTLWSKTEACRCTSTAR